MFNSFICYISIHVALVLIYFRLGATGEGEADRDFLPVFLGDRDRRGDFLGEGLGETFF
jgi:hypothetical protein